MPEEAFNIPVAQPPVAQPPLDFSQLVEASLLIVAAHPDDEAIGIGAHFALVKHALALVHVTDGAPRNEQDARNAGFNSWRDYATARQQETKRALRTAGVEIPNVNFEIPDQQTIHRIEDAVGKLMDLMTTLRPELILTHPYEGGHPDHDSVALCVHAACHLLRSKHETDITIAEFASYHAGPEGTEVECFLDQKPSDTFRLSESQRAGKLELFRCYPTQANVLQWFPCAYEPVRRAPQYDFAHAPHPGKLHYEQFNWGVDGETWRTVATPALQKLCGRTCL